MGNKIFYCYFSKKNKLPEKRLGRGRRKVKNCLT
jgi:hypothetical protein